MNEEYHKLTEISIQSLEIYSIVAQKSRKQKKTKY